MTPADILPFYFAIEAAPTDSRCAFALARPIPDGAEVGVSVVLEDDAECDEVFRFSRLGVVKMAWSARGESLAFAHDATLMLRDARGALQLAQLAGNARWLGFDRDQRLWCLAGRRLEVRSGNCVEATIDRVESAAVSEVVAYCLRQDGLCLYTYDGQLTRRLACLSESIDNVTVQLSLQGHYLTVALASTPVNDRSRVRILWVDLSTSRFETLMDEHLAFGFNGGPAIEVVTLKTGEVLARYENGPCCQVWSLSPSALPTPISPDGFEVFEFAIDATGNRLALVASETQSAIGASERQLLMAERERDRWRFLSPMPGVYQMPRWRYDGKLEVLCGDKGHWTRHTYAPNEAGAYHDSRWCTAIHVSTRSVEYDVVRLPGPQQRHAGIILLPRLNQQFVAGAQSFFFHHLLFSYARCLAQAGYSVALLSGPGGIGRGLARREPAVAYFQELRSAIQDLAQSMCAEGCSTIGILAGSLGALPALRLSGRGTPFSACAFVSPLFEASIPVTSSVAHHLIDNPAIASFDDAIADLQIPVLVIRGARDEVVPDWQISRLCDRTQGSGLVELCVFENEGHIFRHVESWERAQAAIEGFFMSRLACKPEV